MTAPPSIARHALAIAFLALLLALVYNGFSPKPLPLLRTPPKVSTVADSVLFAEPARSPFPAASREQEQRADTVGPANTKVIAPLHERALARKDSLERPPGKKPETVYTTITLDQLKKLLDRKRGVVLDARNEEEYRNGHITGARSIPALEIDKHIEEIVAIPRDTLVLIYCNNAECPLGRQLAEFMNSMEFTKIFLYDDGWDGWEKAKMPIDTSGGVRQ